MASEMPERIWLPVIDDAAALAVKTGPDEVEYVRADITADLVDDTLTPAYMLGFENGKNAAAATHQRTLEALREALTDVREAIMKADPEVLTCTFWMHNSPAETVVDYIDAALARIKEAT